MARLVDSDRSLRRASLTVAGTIIAVVAGLWLLYLIRSVLYMGFVALFLSVAVEPAVQYLDKRGWRRGVATAVVFLVLTVAGLGVLASIVPVVISEVSDLIENLPAYIESLEGLVGEWLNIDLLSPSAEDEVSGLGSLFDDLGPGLAGGLLGFGSTVVGAAFQLFTIALFAFYMVAEGPELRRTVFSFLPARRQREMLRIWEVAVEKTGGYVYSRVILAVVSALFTTGLLLLLGVDFAVALGIWVGVLGQFVPVVGTYIGAVFPVLVALADDPLTALWVAVGLIAYQQLENLLISPKVTSRTMEIHPAVSVAAIIIGGALMGGTGIVLALPVAAIIQAVISTTINRHSVIAEAQERDEATPEISPDGDTESAPVT